MFTSVSYTFIKQADFIPVFTIMFIYGEKQQSKKMKSYYVYCFEALHLVYHRHLSMQ